MDVRPHNTNRLCGFTKHDDLIYFLHTLAGIDCQHAPEFDPSPKIHKANQTGQLPRPE